MRPYPANEVPYHLRPGAPQRRVVCAAHRLIDEPVMAVAPRHFHPLIHQQIAAHVHSGTGSKDAWRMSEQGFIDQWGTFMDRKEAFQVAKAAGQLLYGPHLPAAEELDSSDLY